MLAKIRTAAPFAFLALVTLLDAYVIRATVLSYYEEKEHAAFLYDCTHSQRPEACENEWQSQYAHIAPPWAR
jgi:hypothetical protein